MSTKWYCMPGVCVSDKRYGSIHGTDASTSSAAAAAFTLAVTSSSRWSAEQSSFVSEWCVCFGCWFADTWWHVRATGCQCCTIMRLNTLPHWHVATSLALFSLLLVLACLWVVSLMNYAFDGTVTLLCIVQLMLWKQPVCLLAYAFIWLQFTDAKVL